MPELSKGVRSWAHTKACAILGSTIPGPNVSADNVISYIEMCRREGTNLQGRVIPTSVKLAVWKRDSGKCVICGASDDLHFDHDVPWVKGGTSLVAEKVQLLCARHNLAKRDHIV